MIQRNEYFNDNELLRNWDSIGQNRGEAKKIAGLYLFCLFVYILVFQVNLTTYLLILLRREQIDENLLARPAYETTSARSATEYAYDACPPQQPYPIRVNHYYANCVEQEDQDVYDVEAEAQEEEEEEEDEDEFYELQLGGKKQSEINYKNLFQFKSHFDVGGSPKPKYQLHVHEQSSSKMLL